MRPNYLQRVALAGSRVSTQALPPVTGAPEVPQSLGFARSWVMTDQPTSSRRIEIAGVESPQSPVLEPRPENKPEDNTERAVDVEPRAEASRVPDGQPVRMKESARREELTSPQIQDMAPGPTLPIQPQLLTESVRQEHPETLVRAPKGLRRTLAPSAPLLSEDDAASGLGARPDNPVTEGLVSPRREAERQPEKITAAHLPTPTEAPEGRLSRSSIQEEEQQPLTNGVRRIHSETVIRAPRGLRQRRTTFSAPSNEAAVTEERSAEPQTITSGESLPVGPRAELGLEATTVPDRFVSAGLDEGMRVPAAADLPAEPQVMDHAAIREMPPARAESIARDEAFTPKVQPLAVPLPSTAASAREENRITIGRIEVQVNNRLPQTPAEPKPETVAVSSPAFASLEAHYLERFFLRR